MDNIDPIHPGEHLAEFLGISQYRLAKVIGTPPRRINEIVHGRRSHHGGYGGAFRAGLSESLRVPAELAKFDDLDLARASIDIGSIESLSVAP